MLNARQLADVALLAVGALSPLEVFMNSRDYASVRDSERLANGIPWTIPVTLAVGPEIANRLKASEAVALTDSEERIVAVLELEEIFPYDREKEAEAELQTSSDAHPGVVHLR